MKIYTNERGAIVAEAENVAEVSVLLALGEKKQATRVVKRKKHVFKKECKICEESFIGARGLGRHYALRHGIPGVFNRKQGTVQEKREAFNADLAYQVERAQANRDLLNLLPDYQTNKE